MGISGTAALGLLGLIMLIFRSFCEPILREALPLFAAHLGGYYRYEPSRYYLWAWLPVVCAVIWFAVFLRAWVNKPGEDRRIDAALRAEMQQTARGAPIEPDLP